MTGGRGVYHASMSHYEEVPREQAEKVDRRLGEEQAQRSGSLRSPMERMWSPWRSQYIASFKKKPAQEAFTREPVHRGPQGEG